VTVRLVTRNPEPRGLAADDAALSARLEVEAGATGRSLAVKVDGSTVLTWSGGSPTVSGGFGGSVVLDGTTLDVEVTKVGGWAHGTAVTWSVSYYDSVTASESFEGSFALVGVTIVRTSPVAGGSGAARRPDIYVEAKPDAGTPLGVDLVVGGEAAILNTVVQTPAFVGRTGVTESNGYGVAQPRRAFAWGGRVEVIARPVVSVSGTAYWGRHAFTFTTTPRSSRATPELPVPPSDDPVRETVRQLAASALRPDGGSPALTHVLDFYLRRTEVGGLLPQAPGLAVELDPIDIPHWDTLTAFVNHIEPLWRTLLSGAPPEFHEALARAWSSGHVAERVGAVCVILASRS